MLATFYNKLHLQIRVLLLHVGYQVLLTVGERDGDHHYQQNDHRQDHDQGEDEEHDDRGRVDGVLDKESVNYQRDVNKACLSNVAKSEIEMVDESGVVGSVQVGEV